MPDLLPVIVCPECQEPFTQIPRRDGTFPPACKQCIRSYWGKQRHGQCPPHFRAAIDRRQQQSRRRNELALQQEFAPLSDRDLRIFAFGVGVGYKRGFNVAYGARQRKPR